jgi:hypothetical protein
VVLVDTAVISACFEERVLIKKVKVQITLLKATKAQRRSRGMALHFI